MTTRVSLVGCLLALGALGQGPVRGAERLYVLNSLSDDVTVVDVASNRVLDSIRVGPQPHGVAVPAARDRMYISTEGDDSLVVVDLLHDRVLARYHVLGHRPNEIEVTADGRLVYVPASADGEYEVFDTKLERIVARIPTDGAPHNVVVSPDDRYMYLSPLKSRPGGGGAENRKIYVVDAHAHEVLGTVPLENAPRPTAISPDGKRLYVNTDNLLGFVVVDTAARRVVAEARYPLTPEELASPSRSHGIGVTPDGKEVWSTDINHGVVHVFDVTGPVPVAIARMKTGNQPLWVAVAPDGRSVYVANKADDTVSVFDVASKRERTRIRLDKGKGPQRMLVVDVPLGEAGAAGAPSRPD